MTTSDRKALEQIYANWAQGNFWEFESFDEDVRARWATEVPDMGSSEGIQGLSELLNVWTMRDGQALAIRAYSDRDRALREVGLA